MARQPDPAAAERPAQAVSDDAVAALLAEGAYDRAESLAEIHFALAQKTFGPSLQAARAADVYVKVLCLNGKGSTDRTYQIAYEALQIKQQAPRADDADLVVSETNFGNTLIERAKYQDAIVVLRQALAKLERAGQPALDLTTVLDSLGRALNLVDRGQESVDILARSLRLKEANAPDDNLEMARTLREMGFGLQILGDYAKARPVLSRAMALEELQLTTHPDFVETLLMWWRQLWFEGDVQGSRDVAYRAIEAAQASLRPGHPAIAASFDKLGLAVAEMGDVALGRHYLELALDIGQQTLSAQSREVADYLNDLALPTFEAGEYVKARSLFERAEQAYKSSLGPDNPRVAQALLNLGIVDEELGDYATTKADYQQALAIWEHALGPAHPFLAIALDNLADVNRREGSPAVALTLLQRALAIRMAALGATHRDVARTLDEMATTLLQMGDADSADALTVRALRTLEGIETPPSRDLADAYIKLGTVQLRRGSSSDARQSFSRALEIRRKAFGLGHPASAEAQAGLAESLAKVGDYPAALQDAVEAERTGREHLRLILQSLPERESLNYASTRPKSLDVVLSLIERSPDSVEAGEDAIIRSRTLVLDEMALRRAFVHDGTADLKEAGTRLAAAEQRLANLVVRGPQSRATNYVQLVDDARHDREVAARALADRSPEFRNENAQIQIGLDDVRSALPTDGALVSYARYEQLPLEPSASGAPGAAVPSYVALIIAGGERVVAVNLGPAAPIDALIGRWRASAVSQRPDAAGSRKTGAKLRELIWDPIASHIGRAKIVFLVTDGSLSLVPFDGLPVDNGKYLAETAPVVHYLTAERDLARLETKAQKIGKGMLAIGGPAFDDRTVFNSQVRRSSTQEQSATSPVAGSFRSGCGNLQDMTFEPLYGSLQEVRDLKRLWTSLPAYDREAELLVGRAATEHALKIDAPGHRVVHLATHGFFFGDDCQPTIGGRRAVGGLVVHHNGARASTRPLVDDPLLMTGLAFAGANRRAAAATNEDDGILTGEEVAAMNLDGVEWVVLSACDTGLGQITRDEGVVGLRRAFQVAGARSIIMSLWPVEDVGTRSWMRTLYKERFENGRGTAEAVRLANLSALQSRRSKGQSTNPFYWAAFISAGDWR
jgi:CHAT domain-containing protein/tetratricopeptide (TPR) repeat protein